MRWKSYYKRVVKKFAIFPVKSYAKGSTDFEYRWLEIVYLNQHRDWLFGVFPVWRTDAYATKREYELYRQYRKEDVSDDSGSVSERCN
jgi:hypothetical protein